MERLSNVTVVEDGESLHTALDLALARGFEAPRLSTTSGGEALDPLLEVIRDFVWSGNAPVAAAVHPAQRRFA
jgi:hypothetical protein